MSGRGATWLILGAVVAAELGLILAGLIGYLLAGPAGALLGVSLYLGGAFVIQLGSLVWFWRATR